MNRLVLFALSAALHLYVAWRLIPSLIDWPWVAAALAALLLLSYGLLHVGLKFRRRVHRFTDL